MEVRERALVVYHHAWLAELLSKEMEEPDTPEQTEKVVDDDVESDLVMGLNDEVEPTEDVFADSPSSESLLTTNKHYPLRSRVGGAQPPNCLM